MNAERILEIANHPETPKFIFGSDELKEWTRQHRNERTGRCINSSSWYVVKHISLNPEVRPDHEVLSCWKYGDTMPFSHEIPATECGINS